MTPSVFTWLTTIASVLIGGALTLATQSTLARRDRKFRTATKFRDAVAAFATAVQSLRSAEYQRAQLRISDAPDEEREPARQDVYRLRGEAWSAYYVLRLAAQPGRDDAVLGKAKDVIEQARLMSAGSETAEDLRSRSSAVTAALDDIVDGAPARSEERGTTRSATW